MMTKIVMSSGDLQQDKANGASYKEWIRKVGSHNDVR